MSTSFIVNPEIKLVISNKNIPRNNKSKDEKSSQNSTPSQVKFSDHERDLLKKINNLQFSKLSTKEVKKEKPREKHAKREKTTAFTLSEVKKLKEDLGDSFLCDIISVAELQLPENEIVERNPELEARVQRLKAQQEQRVYNSMTKNVDSSRKHIPEETISYQLKQINRQLIAVAQFVFSVISGFFFGFLGIELIVGNLDFGFRLLLGIICALVIALAEIYFLAKKLNEEMPMESPPTSAPPASAAEKKTN